MANENITFEQVLKTTAIACRKQLIGRLENEKVLECATQIYIAQMKGVDNNVSVSENTTEQGG